jgi:hypothetical protein
VFILQGRIRADLVTAPLIADLPSIAERAIFCRTQPRKEGRAVMTIFRHYRQLGPVNALQMRLQG